VSRVFDNPESVLAGESLDRRYVNHHPANMHGYYAYHIGIRLYRTGRFACSQLLKLARSIFQVDIQRFAIAIDEKRDCALISYNFGSRSEGHRRYHYHLTRTKLERFDRKVKCCCAGIECDSMAGAHSGGKFHLKPFNFRPCRKPARAESVGYFANLSVG
jgi:hypothetical protein